MDLATATPGVLRLEIGDPNFQTPAHISAASADWVRHNRVSYPPNSGLTDLRRAVAEKVTGRNGIACVLDNVNITVGATGALYLALLATIEDGDEVLVPDPGWAGYPAMVGLAGGVMRPYGLQAQNGFKLTAEDVATAITPRTRAIILNTPSNPTGAVFDEAQLRAVLALAREHDIWIIADECYDEILFERRHFCIGSAEPIEDTRVLSCFSFSKTYAMTGWRVGYIVAPVAISRNITRMQAAAVASASVVSQIAALEALNGPQDAVGEMVRAYARRRDLAVSMLDAAGLRYTQPDGALYVFLDIRSTGVSSKDFALGLLRDRQVCTTPGSAFGDSGEGFLRLSLACSDADLEAGLRRTIAYVQERSAL
jgi:aspartate/methionine/tyrosine aminotransferase